MSADWLLGPGPMARLARLFAQRHRATLALLQCIQTSQHCSEPWNSIRTGHSAQWLRTVNVPVTSICGFRPCLASACFTFKAERCD